MRTLWRHVRRSLPWLAALLAMDALAAFLLWLVDTRALAALVPLLVLATLVLFGILVAVLGAQAQRREAALAALLACPDAEHERELRRLLPAADGDAVHALAQALADKDRALHDARAQQADYANYVEQWAHEVKTPLALLTLVLDNRRAELPSPVAFKLDYVRNRTQELVGTMLCYARLRGARKDYRLAWLDPSECIAEVLEDYAPLLGEKGFCVEVRAGGRVYADRRGLVFILSQVVSNSVNYAAAGGAERPALAFELEADEGACGGACGGAGSDGAGSDGGATAHGAQVLRITDNGMGVRPCDLPYVFERGFTGDNGARSKRSTGMGLYLAREVARDMGLTIDATTPPEGGFQISLTMPGVSVASSPLASPSPKKAV